MAVIYFPYLDLVADLDEAKNTGALGDARDFPVVKMGCAFTYQKRLHTNNYIKFLMGRILVLSKVFSRPR